MRLSPAGIRYSVGVLAFVVGMVLAAQTASAAEPPFPPSPIATLSDPAALSAPAATSIPAAASSLGNASTPAPSARVVTSSPAVPSEPKAEPVFTTSSSAVEPVLTTVTPVLQPALGTITPLVEPVLTTVEPVLATVEPVVEPVLTTVEPVVEPVLGTVAPVAEPVLTTITPVLEPLLATVTRGIRLLEVVLPVPDSAHAGSGASRIQSLAVSPATGLNTASWGEDLRNDPGAGFLSRISAASNSVPTTSPSGSGGLLAVSAAWAVLGLLAFFVVKTGSSFSSPRSLSLSPFYPPN